MILRKIPPTGFVKVGRCVPVSRRVAAPAAGRTSSLATPAATADCKNTAGRCVGKYRASAAIACRISSVEKVAEALRCSDVEAVAREGGELSEAVLRSRADRWGRSVASKCSRPAAPGGRPRAASPARLGLTAHCCSCQPPRSRSPMRACSCRRVTAPCSRQKRGAATVRWANPPATDAPR